MPVARWHGGGRCTCVDPHINGPCDSCEYSADREQSMREAPEHDDPAGAEDAMDRMERMYERHLDQIGGSA